MDKDIFEKQMEKIPFPEHIYQGLGKSEIDFLRRNWSGNLEKFVNNCSKEIGIEIGEYDPKTGVIPVKNIK